MPSFADAPTVLSFYTTLFGLGGTVNTPSTFYIGLLDATNTELTDPSYARQAVAAGAANWSTFTNTTDCAGSTTSGVGTTGITNQNAIDFGVIGSGETWAFRYVSIFDGATGTATEIARIDLGSTQSLTSPTGVTIASGSLTLGSQYLIA